MRDSRTTRTTHSRIKRRAIIVTLVLGTNPMVAQQPHYGPPRAFPPLPLMASTDAEVEANPFCVAGSHGNRIELTSGTQPHAIRLKPVGVTIGLQPICEPEVSIVKAQSAVGLLPVADGPSVESLRAAHHSLTDSISPQVHDATKVNYAPSAQGDASVHQEHRSGHDESATADHRSSIVLVPRTASLIQTETPTDRTPLAEAAAAEADEPSLEPHLPMEENARVEASPTTEPVIFSITDAFDRTADVQQAETAPGAAPETGLTDAATIIDAIRVNLDPVNVGSQPATNLPEPIAIAQPQEMVTSETGQHGNGLQWVRPVVIDEQPTRPAPVPSVAETQPLLEPPPTVIPTPATRPASKIIYRDEPAVAAPVAPAEVSLHDTRYRPPVAVTQIPVAIGRGDDGESTAITRPAVKSVQAPQLDPSSVPNTADSIPRENLTTLYMSRTQIRSLTIGGKLKGVKVGNQSVCQAFSAGANELKLIGTGNGVTQLVVWAEGEKGDKTLMRAFEVHVADTVGSADQPVAERIVMLNQSIGKMFPECNVQVTRRGDHLLVRGNCHSDETAKKIVRIVRKTCLVPVRDELEIR